MGRIESRKAHLDSHEFLIISKMIPDSTEYIYSKQVNLYIYDPCFKV
jgi:hypothetical protein